MRPNALAVWITVAVAISVLAGNSAGQQTVAQQLSILDEKLDRLRADVEALQFNQQQMQKDIQQLQTQLQELRRSGGGVSAEQLQTLEARVRALDAAREKDKQVILDTLAKELAALGSSKPAAKPAGGTKEHVVQKSDTLSSIAKQYGVSADAIAKANNITNPNTIQVGQKLVIPGK